MSQIKNIFSSIRQSVPTNAGLYATRGAAIGFSIVSFFERPIEYKRMREHGANISVINKDSVIAVIAGALIGGVASVVNKPGITNRVLKTSVFLGLLGFNKDLAEVLRLLLEKKPNDRY